MHAQNLLILRKKTVFSLYLLSVLGLFFCVDSARAQQQDSSAVADSALLKELMQEMNPGTGATAPAVQNQGTTIRSNANMNPDISVISDLRMHYDAQAERQLDTYLNEIEFAFKSTIDPYARADIYMSAHRHEDGHFAVVPEEAYLTTLALPAKLQLKVGKFRSAFGRVNPIHPHALRTTDIPVMFENYFGESLSDEGLSLSWLVPNPLDFYQELTIQATRGPDESPSFAYSNKDKYLTLAHLKNFWDINDNATLELGLSGVTGPNETDFTTQIGGVDLTYKWKPLRYNTYHSFEFQTEALFSKMKIAPNESIETWAMYSMMSYQLSRRWYAGARFDYSNLPEDPDWVEKGYSAFLSWEATEFQKVEMQFKRSTFEEEDAANQFIIRSIFVIGTHGAHMY